MLGVLVHQRRDRVQRSQYWVGKNDEEAREMSEQRERNMRNASPFLFDRGYPHA
jgi:hypothetical protein